MAYKVAGIDVHKKVLMVVVVEVEAEYAGVEDGAPTLRDDDQRTAPFGGLAAGAGSARSGDGIDRAILEAGLVRVGGADAICNWRKPSPTGRGVGGSTISAMPNGWCGGWWRTS